ncbi:MULTISPECIES: hypothetical protein [Streptomyces]|uniref:Restriction endonuclease domain-containing protein n=1 Tax=Streptomyces canarius TaxID=285453 RepID=A0ABQ3CJJ0_9ACTN|nr:hypothetical protein [Streptomyces canarius]GHA14958.1 hypothetical protein GCM10010345_19460 [Streptomyces canarius]
MAPDGTSRYGRVDAVIRTPLPDLLVELDSRPDRRPGRTPLDSLQWGQLVFAMNVPGHRRDEGVRLFGVGEEERCGEVHVRPGEA